jgi:hypothetical protein
MYRFFFLAMVAAVATGVQCFAVTAANGRSEDTPALPDRISECFNWAVAKRI